MCQMQKFKALKNKFKTVKKFISQLIGLIQNEQYILQYQSILQILRNILIQLVQQMEIFSVRMYR